MNDPNQIDDSRINAVPFEKVSDEVYLGLVQTNYKGAMCKVPESVTVLDHVLIGETEDGFQLKADFFYKTKRPDKPRPAIIFMHDWASGKNPARAGDRQGSYLALCHDYVFVSLFYRPPLDGYCAPCAIKDVRACARWLRSMADEYAIMTNGIVAMGSSAGTQWAFLAATANGAGQYDDSCGYREYSGDINLVVLVSAMVDLMDTRGGLSGVAKAMIGASYEDAPEKYRLYSRLQNIRSGLPPTFILQGEKDNSKLMLTLRDRLRSFGNDAELAIWPGAGHGGGPAEESLWLVSAFIRSRLLSGTQWP